MARGDGTAEVVLWTLAVLLLLATSQLGVGMVNWIATLLVTPRPLPRMDFSRGLPSQSRTLVVVPTMLAGAASIESLIEALEVRFLANRDDNLHFGLLTTSGCVDETRPEDESLLQLARSGIDSLNAKYGRVADAPGTTVPVTPSFSFTARGAGIRRSGSGWVTSASAGSSRT